MGKLAVSTISIITFVVYFGILIAPTFDYGRMIFAFLIVAAFGVVVLMVARYAITITKIVTLKGVGSGFAISSANQAIWAAEDHVIGWPSGTFLTEWDQQRETLVAREFLPQGSGSIVMSFVKVPWKIAVYIVAAFSVFGVYGFFVSLFLAVIALGGFLFFFVVPLALAWLVEIVFKKPARSLIEITVEELDDAAQLTFKFKGASALIVMNNVMNAFNPPVLPPKYAGLIAPVMSTVASASTQATSPIAAGAPQ